MKTEAQMVAERVERVLASEQWRAISKSFASRMDVTSFTSLSITEKLERGEVSFWLNYEKRTDGLQLSTYDGEFIPKTDGLGVGGPNAKSAVKLRFNAEGKYVFDFREAINLLEGRAVLKSYVSLDGASKEGWFKANNDIVDKSSRFYFTGGQTILKKFDLEAAVDKLPGIDLGIGQKRDLIRSLESGDLRQMKQLSGDKEVDVYIQAVPDREGVSIIEKKTAAELGRFALRDLAKKTRLEKSPGKSIEW